MGIFSRRDDFGGISNEALAAEVARCAALGCVKCAEHAAAVLAGRKS